MNKVDHNIELSQYTTMATRMEQNIGKEDDEEEQGTVSRIRGGIMGQLTRVASILKSKTEWTLTELQIRIQNLERNI